MAKWLSGNGNGHADRDTFPPTGVVALIDGAPAAVAFVYLMVGGLGAMIAFTTVDPFRPSRQRLDAAERAVQGAIAMAKDHLGGRGFIETVNHYSGLHRIFLRQPGFQDGGKINSAFCILDGSVDPNMLK